MAYLMILAILAVLFIFAVKFLRIFYIPAALSVILIGIYFGPYGLNLAELFLNSIQQPEKLQTIQSAIEVMALIAAVMHFSGKGIRMDLTPFKKESRSIFIYSLLMIFLAGSTGFIYALLSGSGVCGGLILCSVFICISGETIQTVFAEHTISDSRLGKILTGADAVLIPAALLLLTLALEWGHFTKTSLLNGNMSFLNRFYMLAPGVLFALSILGILIFAAFTVFAAPKLMGFVMEKLDNKIHFPFVLILVLLIFAFLGESMGIPLIAGVFAGGAVFALSGSLKEHKEDLEKHFRTMGFWLVSPFLLYSFGADAKFGSVFQANSWIYLLLLPVIFLVVRWAVSYTALKSSGLSHAQAWNGGLLSSTIMTSGLFVALTGKNAGYISVETYTGIIVCALVSCFTAPIIFRLSSKKKKIHYGGKHGRLSGLNF